MIETIEKLSIYFNHSYVVNAMIVAILVSLSSSLFGVTLVLKRFSFIGDGLSHVAFFAMAVSAIIKTTIDNINAPLIIKNDMFVILIITIIMAIFILCRGEGKKVKSDSTIAMISVSSLALGYLLMNKFPISANISGDVCTTLFGSSSILTLSYFQVLLSVILSAIVIIIFILYYNKIFAITFDENFVKAIGISVNKYNFLIATIIAVIIVLAMNLVGSLLTSALIIFPTLSSIRVFKSFKSVVISSAIVSIFCSSYGIILAILDGAPVGSTIVLVNIIIFIIFSFIEFIKKIIIK